MTSLTMIAITARLRVPEHSLYAVSINVKDAPCYDSDDSPSDLLSGHSAGSRQ